MRTLLYLPRFDESGAAPRYRVYQYLNHLKQIGIQVEVKPLLTKTYLNKLYFTKKRSLSYLLRVYMQRAIFLLVNKKKYDLVLMDGELFPYLPFFIEKWLLPTQFIMDQDDAIFHTYDQHRSWLVRKVLGKKIDRIMQRCQHVIIGNDYVKKRALASGAKQVTALPTVVNAEKYKPSEMHEKKELIIGWVGSPTTVKALSLIEPALRKVAHKENFILHIIGAELTIEGVKTVCTDWKDGWNEEEEIRLTNTIDIGIMPLNHGAYELGKCGFKLIKYMACAKPMLASSVGMNQEIVNHGIDGYLAHNLEEWENYLLALIQNPELREKMGIAGRKKMLQQFSLQATAPIFCDIVTKAFPGRA